MELSPKVSETVFPSTAVSAVKTSFPDDTIVVADAVRGSNTSRESVKTNAMVRERLFFIQVFIHTAPW